MGQERRHFCRRAQAGISSPAGEQRSVIGADRRGAGHLSLDAAQLAQSQRRAGCRDGVAFQHIGVDVFPGSDGRKRPASPRERSPAHGARHFKKGCGHLLGTAEMKFRLIEDHRDTWPVRVMCAALSVSPSGYYAWRSRPASPRKIANRALLVDIQRVHAQHRERYGAPRIHAELRAEGHGVSRKRVARLMRQHGIRARAPRRYRVCTTDSKHSLPVAVNLLDQNFVADRPDQIWLADITYIPTAEGWLYLAVILDLFTRKVVGWAMRDHLRAELTIAALTMAIQRRRPAAGLIHHSDRGSQSAAGDYCDILQAAAVVQSMSRKGNCWDNAPMESFFGTLKTELVHQDEYPNRDAARRDLFVYIEGYYNRQRRHSAIGYITPEQAEAKSA